MSELGFDFVTLQPNFAFHNSTRQRFANVSEIMDAQRWGVEMELPLTVRNGDIPGLNSTTSFYAYMDAAAQLGWVTGALKTFYCAGAQGRQRASPLADQRDTSTAPLRQTPTTSSRTPLRTRATR